MRRNTFYLHMVFTWMLCPLLQWSSRESQAGWRGSWKESGASSLKTTWRCCSRQWKYLLTSRQLSRKSSSLTFTVEPCFCQNPSDVTACYWWTILDTDVHTFLADQHIRLHVWAFQILLWFRFHVEFKSCNLKNQFALILFCCNKKKKRKEKRCYSPFEIQVTLVAAAENERLTLSPKYTWYPWAPKSKKVTISFGECHNSSLLHQTQQL